MYRQTYIRWFATVEVLITIDSVAERTTRIYVSLDPLPVASPALHRPRGLTVLSGSSLRTEARYPRCVRGGSIAPLIQEPPSPPSRASAFLSVYY